MKKEKENPNHHMGKETGYDLIDGEYHIAPAYQQQFETLFDEEEGIKKMLEIVTINAARGLVKVHEAKRKVWAVLSEDLGLDMERMWTYHDGVVKERKNDNQVDH